jgi:hypothetical protein
MQFYALEASANIGKLPGSFLEAQLHAGLERLESAIPSFVDFIKSAMKLAELTPQAGELLVHAGELLVHADELPLRFADAELHCAVKADDAIQQLGVLSIGHGSIRPYDDCRVTPSKLSTRDAQISATRSSSSNRTLVRCR